MIVIPYEDRLDFEYVRIPRETPVGILENDILQITWAGRTFQADGDYRGGSLSVMDIETGEFEELRFEMNDAWFDEEDDRQAHWF